MGRNGQEILQRLELNHKLPYIRFAPVLGLTLATSVAIRCAIDSITTHLSSLPSRPETPSDPNYLSYTIFSSLAPCLGEELSFWRHLTTPHRHYLGLASYL